MSQMTERCIEPLQTAAFGLPVSRPQVDDSRTLLKRCLLDTVLPAAALLSMSALTVTMIVVVVTTVAHGGWLAPGTYVNVDPWATVYSGSTVLRQDDILYRDAVMGPGAEQGDSSFEPQARNQADTGYFAAQLPE